MSCSRTKQRCIPLALMPSLDARRKPALYFTMFEYLSCKMHDGLCPARQRAAEEVGAREAAALLQDWLVLFAAAYNRSLSRTEGAGPATAAQVPLLPQSAWPIWHC